MISIGEFMIKKIFFIFLLFFSPLIFSITYFLALPLNKAIKRDLVKVQRIIKHNLPGNFKFLGSEEKNLHITIKVIGHLNNREIQLVDHAIKKAIRQYHKFDLGRSIRHGKLKVNADGLILLMLKENRKLTILATRIDKALKKLKRRHKIRELSMRLDFPNSGHITLGKIVKKTANSQYPVKFLSKCSIKINRSYLVDNIVLFSSNSPNFPRKYKVKKQFYLK